MTITLHGRIPSKKNSKRIVMFGHRPGLLSSKDYEAWHTMAMYEVKQQLGNRNLAALGGAYRMVIALWSPTAQKGDLTNKAESIMDLLVDCKVLEDDNWSVVPEIDLRYMGIDRVNPRAEIDILKPSKVEKVKTS